MMAKLPQSIVGKFTPTLRTSWDRLSQIPGGKKVFSRMIGLMAPYSGSIGAEIVDLKRGYCRAEMKDSRRVRNHLNSVHAMALVNLAEIASGVGMLYSLPDNARGILTGFAISYLKKARGVISSECTFEPVTSTERHEREFNIVLSNSSGEVVAQATAKWLIGPTSEKGT